MRAVKSWHEMTELCFLGTDSSFFLRMFLKDVKEGNGTGIVTYVDTMLFNFR